jgi:hypothetical protein
MRRFIIVLVLCFVYCGCFGGLQKYMYDNLKPVVQTYVDPDASFDARQRFTVVPSSMLSIASSMNTIAEKQMMFFVRSAVEERGYEYTADPDSADFVVAFDGSVEYKERYVPLQIMSIPSYTPPQMVTIDSRERGTFTGKIGSESTHGDYTGRSSTTVMLPGQQTNTVTSTGGYSVGVYIPTLKMFIYDGVTRQNIWYAVGTTESLSPDVRLGTQPIALAQIQSLPTRKQGGVVRNLGGITFAIKTQDGNTFWPVITEVEFDSPAGSADLRKGDVITKIGPTDTRNLPYSRIRSLLAGNAGETKALELHSSGEEQPFIVEMKF